MLEEVHVCFCLSGLSKLVTDIFSKRASRTTCLCPPLWSLQNSLRIPYVCLSCLFKTGCGYRMSFFLHLFEITRIVYHVLCPRYRSQSLQGGSMFSVLGVGLKTCLARLYILCPQHQSQIVPQERPCSLSSVSVSVSKIGTPSWMCLDFFFFKTLSSLSLTSEIETGSDFLYYCGIWRGTFFPQNTRLSFSSLQNKWNLW